jgi:TonB-linked SusC/RagA family outer membrane protein
MKNISIFLIVGAVASCFSAAAQDDNLTAHLDSIDRTIHVAFRTVDESDIQGGVSTINVERLSQKNYSTYSLDLQADMTNYTWGIGNELVMVDGVPRDANNVLPTEIESITYLKGAQAIVLYGSRAANGVVYITTKRGHNDGLKASVRGNVSLFVPKSYPEYLGSAEYMTLYNEARANDGLDAAFSQEDIYNYASGNNIYRYPSTNFFSSDYIKKSYTRYDGTAEFSGGGKYAHFYANIGLYNVNDLIAFGEGKDNHTTRLNVRGNVDLTINDWVTGYVNANATFYDSRSDRSNYWSQSATLRPTNPGSSPLVPLIPISFLEENDENSWILVNNSHYIVDGKYLLGGTQNYSTNPFAAMYAAGYNKYTSRQFYFDAGVNINLNKLVEGLAFHTHYAVDYSMSYNTSIENSYATYEASWNNYSGSDLITSLTKYNEDKRTGTQNLSSSSERQTMMFSADFTYNKTFGDVHNFDALLAANGFQLTNTGVYHRTSNANLALRLGYNYDKRYYAELNSSVTHSAKLAPGHRNAFSPVVTLGWNLAKEEWLKESDVINNLRINATYGIINQDIDIDGYYNWKGVFTSADGTWWGWSNIANSIQTFDVHRSTNEDLTFVKRKEFNIGLTAELFNRNVKFNANFFNITNSGLLVESSTQYPSYFSSYWPVASFIPYINYNCNRRTGFDFAISGQKRIGNVDVALGVNGLYRTTKNTKIDENVEYEWLRTEGKSTSAIWGYQCLGYFADEADVANSATINSNTKPGDLKYVDQNNDGIIDSNDRVVIGDWADKFTLGLNLTLKWNNFTLFVAGNGGFGGKNIKSSSYDWVYGDGKYSAVVRGRWTPETAETATYPRLTTLGSELNFVNSDYWLYNTTRFTLDKVQLTYDLPQQLFRDKFVKGIQVYMSGSSLATISKEHKYLEMNVGSSPQTRCYNLGVKLDF